MALQSAGPQNNKENFCLGQCKTSHLQSRCQSTFNPSTNSQILDPTQYRIRGGANAGGRDEIESSVGEERPCKEVVVVVLLVIDQQRLCNGQEIMRTTTKGKLDIHKSHRGCCSFAAWEGWGYTGRLDRHHHEAHDGGMGSYGDKRARERERQTYRQAYQGRSFSGEKLPQTATTKTKKKRKKSKGGPQTEVHHYEAEMGFFFSSLYNAWHLHSRRSDMPVGAT